MLLLRGVTVSARARDRSSVQDFLTEARDVAGRMPGRPIANVEQVDAVAESMGPRWRLMVYLAVYGSLRPAEHAELRRADVSLPDEPEETRRRHAVAREPVLLRIIRASPDFTTGQRMTGTLVPLEAHPETALRTLLG